MATDDDAPIQAKPTYGGRARISCDSPISNKAVLSVGGVAIPIYEATVRIVAGELVTIEAVVPAEHVDLAALEENTRLIIEQAPKPDQVRPSAPARSHGGNRVRKGV